MKSYYIFCVISCFHLVAWLHIEPVSCQSVNACKRSFNSSACLAPANSYKCSVMINNVKTGRERTRKLFVHALPDILKDEPQISDELRISRATFTSPKYRRCDGRTANARCFTFFNKYTSSSLNTRAKTPLNKDNGTAGQILCDAIYKDVPNSLPLQKDLEIGVYMSYCGERWEPVVQIFDDESSPQQTFRERLCCAKRHGSGRSAIHFEC